MTTYQGWKNYETWNISLWISNDYGIYTAMRAARPFTPQTAETFCREVFPHGTPDMAIGQHGETLSQTAARECLNLVDWQEIADDFNAE
ncbi:hypothetical protein LB543_05060 [Mesorhizobium sp. ESP7-2]|uniref:DUF7249 family protein n=1 Tax=Mesorhizobium sp. ESP7-2 TaxID=2876622 RepID=UPI001CCCB4D0|nr:hypothetical protein [Mesorhizobium sp. ESP7-2]MBZ9706088.1 hypothetical protein [Mesorhizobium sp. ESP7-2]